jgi:hypothetical protein
LCRADPQHLAGGVRGRVHHHLGVEPPFEHADRALQDDGVGFHLLVICAGHS